MKDIDVLLLSWAIVWFVAGFVAAGHWERKR